MSKSNKSLYDESHAHTPEARLLGYDAVEALKETIAEHVKEGYSPHEIEQVICSSIHLHICKLIINIRNPQKNQNQNNHHVL